MKKKIGILGFGLVGRSYVDFLLRHKQEVVSFLFQEQKENLITTFVWDQNPLYDDQVAWLSAHDIAVLDSSIGTMREFVASCDVVLVSAGIDVRGIAEQHKLFVELDLFSHFFNGKSIAVTGTLGKTTITYILSLLLSRLCGALVPAIGNIGKPLLYAIDEQPETIVAELSSFQLERNQFFIPDVAIFSNLYPNHLDRHDTMEHYFAAKWRLFKKQQPQQTSIIPWQLVTSSIADVAKRALSELQSSIIMVAAQQRESLYLDDVPVENFKVVCLEKNNIVLLLIFDKQVKQVHVLSSVEKLSDVTFIENWLMIIAALYASGVSEPVIANCSFNDIDLKEHDHRLSLFTTIKSVDFYDDSKATVYQATQAAVKKLAQNKRPIIVILGGLGKGVDRSCFMDELKAVPGVKKVYSFGAERTSFAGSDSYETLDPLLDDLFATMTPGDQVLFSPSGASFDLFKNYKHRGDVFKELVLKRAALVNS